MKPAADMDPASIELVRYGLDAIVDEMAVTIVRTAHSGNIKNAMDFSCALFDASGNLIAQGLTLPMHLGSMPSAMKAFQAKFSGTMKAGDIYVLNDPYCGGAHLPDLYIFKPVFIGGRMVGWAGTVAHHLDIGGVTPGGNGCYNTEIFQEGLRIPPIRLSDGDVLNEAVFDILALNVRVPRQVLGDVQSQLAACRAGKKGLRKLIERYGIETLNKITDLLLDRSEHYAREAISAIADGIYEFTDHIDSDGINPVPIPIHVTITVEGSSLTADFTGTSPQVAGAINCTLSYAKSAVYAAVRHLIKADVPNNEGYFRPVSIVIPLGTILNPRAPAAVAARGLTGYRIANSVFGALAKAVPDRIFACEVGGDSGIGFAGYGRDGEAFVFLEFLFGSWGGRPNKDGNDCCASAIVNFSNIPIEFLEAEYPVAIEALQFVSDSGGAGKYRGGLAVEKIYEFKADAIRLDLRTDRQVFRPYGLRGGEAGTLSTNVLISKGERRVLPSKGVITVNAGDRFHHVLAGAGGWGDPAQRSKELIRFDISEGKITSEYAREKYGYVE